MDYLIINSPIYDKKVLTEESYLPPLGQGYIATELKKNGFQVSILDAVKKNLTIQEIIDEIIKLKPRYVGLNIFSINNLLVKEIVEKCPIQTQFIIGGKSAKFLSNVILEYNTNNPIFVIVGEGEYITTAIIGQKLQEKPIKQHGNKCVYKVDKDSIYLPRDLSLLDLDRSLFKDYSIINKYGQLEDSIITSRECIYNCAFCGGARSLNRDVPIRINPKEKIIEEISNIINNNPAVQSIRVLDDLFLRDSQSINNAIEIFGHFHLNWRAMAHVNSFEKCDADIFTKLYKSGCKELEIGIETGSDEMRKIINKVGTVNQVKSCVCKILDSGINVKGYFIYGFPDETSKEMNDTYNLVKFLRNYSSTSNGIFRASAFQFRPYHGTKLYDKVVDRIQQYKHSDNLDILSGRSQFNFNAGNFSQCSQEFIDEKIILTNEVSKNHGL